MNQNAGSDDEFRTLFENIDDSVFIHGIDGRIYEVNPAACRLGYTREQLLEMTVSQIVAPEQITIVAPRIQDTLEQSRTRFQSIHLTASGEQVPVEVISRSFVFKGRPAILSVARDLSDRKRAEAALRETRHWLQVAVESSNIGLWNWHIPTNTLSTSPEFKRQLGFSEEELLNERATCGERMHPVDRDRVGRTIQEYIQQPWPNYEIEFRMQHRDGSWRWMLSRAALLLNDAGEPERMLGCQMDITERKAAEIALKERETNLAQASRLARLGMYQWDASKGELRLSPELHEMLGIPVAPVVDPGVVGAMMNPEDRVKAGEAAVAALGEGRPFDIEIRLDSSDGQQRYFHAIGEVLFNEQRAPSGLIGVVQDFTEHYSAQEALRLTESRLARAQAMASIGSWESFPTSKEIWWSDEVFRIFGVNPKTFRPTFDSLFALIDPEDRQKVRAAGEYALKTGEAYQVDHWVNRPDGSRVLVHEQGQVLFSEDGTPRGIAGTVQDITERRRLEEQFFQAQKLESIGRLAGGIAHDFNNLLTVINGYSDIIARNISVLDPNYEKVNEIRHAGARAAALTSQLLAFSRKQIIQPGVLNLNDVVRNALGIVERLMGERVHVVTRLAPSVLKVLADAGQIQQVILNLAANARDAMPDGGELTIRTSLVEPTQADAPQRGKGPYVCLEVSDTGYGMNAQTRSQIFEPFFTTKEPGKGTGLGLSTVYGIVRQNGGWIDVSSEPGHGSSFAVYLPGSNAELASKVSSEPVTTAQCHQTILVVEDQAEVRALAALILRDNGYSVVEAADAESALRVIEERVDPIHLVLTDIVMPGISGVELGQRVGQLRPGLKTIYMSGYTDPNVTANSLDPGAVFVQKPFTPQELTSKIKQILR